MSNDLDDLFDDGGELAVPTMRGNANLDVQDYSTTGGSSDILDDDLQEDTPSRPGDGPGPATDLDASSLEVEPEQSGPGMDQTTFGQHPWGPGGGSGYRPQSMMQTDMELSGEELKKSEALRPDAMTREPEVLAAEDMMAITGQPWGGNRNQQPSNRDLDQDTIYDRESYERTDSSQATIGNGIFEMEEGVTWRPSEGIFAEQYALPAYIAQEDELGVQQSEMWDTTAEQWRVVQPSAGGVPLAARVPHMKRAYSPFVKQPPEMRQEATGPRSHIEAFGRKAAKLIVQEAQLLAPQQRSRFLGTALDALGWGSARQTTRVIKTLIEYGHPPAAALEDTIAHVIMRATMTDLAKGRTSKLNRLAGRVSRTRAAMQAAAAQHLTPLTRDAQALRRDVAALMASPAKLGMGAVSDDPTADASTAASAVAPKSIFSVKNVLIGGAVIGGGWLLWANRKKIVKNVKKLVR